jgi:hypothetical protein
MKFSFDNCQYEPPLWIVFSDEIAPAPYRIADNAFAKRPFTAKAGKSCVAHSIDFFFIHKLVSHCSV